MNHQHVVAAAIFDKGEVLLALPAHLHRGVWSSVKPVEFMTLFQSH